MLVTWEQIIKAVLSLAAAGGVIMWVRYAGGKRIAEQERKKLAEAEREEEVQHRLAG